MKKFPITLIYRGKRPGEIQSPIQPAHLRHWLVAWIPHFAAREKRFGQADPDAHWRWDTFPVLFEDGKNFSAAVVCGDMTQGLLWARRGEFSQMHLISMQDTASEERHEILYVERIATHPVNRGAPQGDYITQHKLVGEHLMRWIVLEALRLGLEGRVGLHSLPDACSWYPGLGMTHIPAASEAGLEYFEFTTEAARRFLEP